MIDAFQNPLDGLLRVGAAEAIRDSLVALASATAGTLWIARSANLRSSAGLSELTIPASVTLSFAPGVVLTLDAGFILTIEGPLDADMEPRFALSGDAKVLLRGPLEVIHAAWWGDGGVDHGDPDGAPVARALDVLWDRYSLSLDPAPIQLAGPYRLLEPVRIAPPPGLAGTFEVVLRGRHHGLHDPTTFVASESRKADELSALVVVQGAVLLTLEHASFDLTRPARQPPAGAALWLAGDYDRSRIEACHFKVVGSTGVRVTAPSGASDGEIAERVTRRAARLVVSRCVFECSLGVGAASLFPNPHGVAIDVDLGAPTSLRVLDSQFFGVYRQAVRFVGAELTVTACTFDNAGEGRRDDLQQGADLLVGHASIPDSRLRGRNAQLTITHCLSTSPTFLVARPVFTAQSDTGGACLTNVVHRPPASGSFTTEASIVWSARYAPRSLLLQGCELGAQVSLGGTSRPGVMVDLGTQFEIVAGDPRHVVGGGVDAVSSLARRR